MPHTPCPMPTEPTEPHAHGAPCPRSPMPHALPAADGRDEDNFVAVLEDGVGGDEFKVEAEAGAIAPLF